MVVPYITPLGERGFVCGEEDGAPAQVPLIDEMEEHVCRIGSDREVADFIDHQEMRLKVQNKSLTEFSPGGCYREVFDEIGGGGKKKR